MPERLPVVVLEVMVASFGCGRLLYLWKEGSLTGLQEEAGWWRVLCRCYILVGEW
jgi:hypothetical protein